MTVVDRYLNIICKDVSNEEIELRAWDYDETIDEIKIRTSLRNTLLYRGWIGDLTYKVIISHDVDSGENLKDTAQSTYKDVLLASIIPWKVDDDFITWEYRFLKK